MLQDSPAFSGFSVTDIHAAKVFYGDTLGLNVEQTSMGLTIRLATGAEVFVYPKGEGHQPASFTILNFPVDDLDQTVDELTTRGVEFEHYDNLLADGPDGPSMSTDEKGILRSDSPEHGPSIAWFKDPAGNILSVLEKS